MYNSWNELKKDCCNCNGRSYGCYRFSDIGGWKGDLAACQ